MARSRTKAYWCWIHKHFYELRRLSQYILSLFDSTEFWNWSRLWECRASMITEWQENHGQFLALSLSFFFFCQKACFIFNSMFSKNRIFKKYLSLLFCFTLQYCIGFATHIIIKDFQRCIASLMVGFYRKELPKIKGNKRNSE